MRKIHSISNIAACSLIAILLLVFSSGLAFAEEKLSAMDILKKMDETVSGYDDQFMDLELTIIDMNKTEKVYTMKVWQKGTEKRFIAMTSGELKDMKVLVKSRNRSYVYLPGFKRVRRIAAHNMNQAFAGSDFTQEDMATAYWSIDWIPAMDREDDDYWYLKLTIKPGEKAFYGHIVMKVGKKDFNQYGTEFYSKQGKLVKTLTAEDRKDYGGGALRNRIVTMVDAATGHKTVLNLKDFKVNQGLKDRMFTERQLQWGR